MAHQRPMPLLQIIKSTDDNKENPVWFCLMDPPPPPPLRFNHEKQELFSNDWWQRLIRTSAGIRTVCGSRQTVSPALSVLNYFPLVSRLSTPALCAAQLSSAQGKCYLSSNRNVGPGTSRSTEFKFWGRAGPTRWTCSLLNGAEFHRLQRKSASVNVQRQQHI